MSLVLVTAPTSEPLSLGEIKSELRIDSDDFDAELQMHIMTARVLVEEHTNRALIQQTYDLYLDGFEGEILLPKPNLLSVDSITYIDSAGSSQVLSSNLYQYDNKSKPGRIRPAYSENWPQTREALNAVTIRFTCGYGAATDIPKPIKRAMILIVGHFFRNKEETTAIKNYKIDFGVEALLGPYTILRVADY